MSRAARKLSRSKFYHVVFQGMNYQDIFKKKQDFKYILEILKGLRQEIQFKMHI